jgi:hypothetical protein
MNGKVISTNYPSIFFELGRILIESVMNNKSTVLFDMPELLLRMKIGSSYSLKEM